MATADMNRSDWWSCSGILVLLVLSCMIGISQTARPTAATQVETNAKKAYPPALVKQGSALFRQDCSFCHKQDTTGKKSGPDLTRSKLVAADVNGEKIAPVVRSGVPEKEMPPFDRTDEQIAS